MTDSSPMNSCTVSFPSASAELWPYTSALNKVSNSRSLQNVTSVNNRT